MSKTCILVELCVFEGVPLYTGVKFVKDGVHDVSSITVGSFDAEWVCRLGRDEGLDLAPHRLGDDPVLLCWGGFFLVTFGLFNAKPYWDSLWVVYTLSDVFVYSLVMSKDGKRSSDPVTSKMTLYIPEDVQKLMDTEVVKSGLLLPRW